MPQFLIAVFILWFLVYGVRWFSRANPAVLAKGVKLGGGIVSLVLAGFLLLRGQIEFAIGLGGLASWLLGWASAPTFAALRWPGGVNKSAGNRSRVRSAMIEMELDHDSGAMQGRVLAGPFEGKSLSELTRPQCEALYATSSSDDPDGARLLEAYLDRRFPGWRPAGQGEGNARGGGDPRRPSAMSEDEAYEVLGLQKGATREDISRAHRGLMKRLHPDLGGPTSLAAKVNEAKDVLMRRHT